jgi:hypothetical protein
VRRVDLILEPVIALHQQLLCEFLRVFSLLKSLEKRKRVKGEPDLRRIAIYFVN